MMLKEAGWGEALRPIQLPFDFAQGRLTSFLGIAIANSLIEN